MAFFHAELADGSGSPPDRGIAGDTWREVAAVVECSRATDLPDAFLHTSQLRHRATPRAAPSPVRGHADTGVVGLLRAAGLAAYQRADRRTLDTFNRNPDGSIGPGVHATIDATDKWRIALRSRRPPVLTMTDRDGELDVVDTRSCATKAFRSLTGLDRAVLLTCDSAPRPERLAAAVRREHELAATDADVADAVEQLIRNQLILPIDGRLVGLAVNGPGAPMPTDREFPGGELRKPEIRRA